MPALDRKKGYEFAPGKIKVGGVPAAALQSATSVLHRIRLPKGKALHLLTLSACAH